MQQQKNISSTNKIEILEYSYWEHFKALKDISLVLPMTHPKRKKIEKSANEILEELHKLKNNGKHNRSKARIKTAKGSMVRC